MEIILGWNNTQQVAPEQGSPDANWRFSDIWRYIWWENQAKWKCNISSRAQIKILNFSTIFQYSYEILN